MEDRAFILFFEILIMSFLSYPLILKIIKNPFLSFIILFYLFVPQLIYHNSFVVYHYPWGGGDDIDYYTGFSKIADLMRRDFNFKEYYELLRIHAGGTNVAIYVVGSFLHYIFGNYYFVSPIFCSFLIVFAGYLISAKLISNLESFRKVKKIFFVLFLLYPMNNYLNMIAIHKDYYILFLLALFFVALFRYKHTRMRKYIIYILFIIYLMFFFRYYLAFVLFLVFGTSFVLWNKINIKSIIFVFILLLFVSYFLSMLFSLNLVEFLLVNISHFMDINIFQNIFSSIRYLITPLPFNSVDAHSYFNNISFFHWIYITLMFISFIKYKQLKEIFPFIVYFIIVDILMGFAYGAINGPRQRIMNNIEITLFASYGLYIIFEKISRKKNEKNNINQLT